MISNVFNNFYNKLKGMLELVAEKDTRKIDLHLSTLNQNARKEQDEFKAMRNELMYAYHKSYKRYFNQNIILTKRGANDGTRNTIGAAALNMAPTITITHDMEREKVVPDVISKSPNSVMKIAYNNLYVQFGNEFTPSQVKCEPSVHWDTEAGAFYTLTMVDPDAPDPKNPTLSQMLHWLIVNIPGVRSKIEALEIDRGDVLAEYVGSEPPNGTGFHRYIFLAYKQPGKLKFDEEFIPASTRTGRPKFKIMKFAEKYQLGTPLAGNVFKAQFDNRQKTSPYLPEVLSIGS